MAAGEDGGGGVAVGGCADVFEEGLHSIMVRVVAGDETGGAKVGFQELEHAEVKALGAIEEDHVDVARRGGKSLEGIADAKLHELVEADGGEILPGALGLFGVELSGDEAAAAIVAESRGEIDGGDAEGGAELDDGLRLSGAGEAVEELAKLGADGHVGLAHALVKAHAGGDSVPGLLGGLVGEGVVNRGVGVEGIEQGSDFGSVDGGFHGVGANCAKAGEREGGDSTFLWRRFS